MRLSFNILSGFLAVVLTAFGGAPVWAVTIPPEVILTTWGPQSKHPLVGRILDTATGNVVDGLALAASATTGAPLAGTMGIVGPTYVLLGEVHDNAEHHWLRAGLLQAIMQRTAYGPSYHPGVVVEHLDDSQTDVLAALGVGDQRTTDKFFAAVAWEKSGWPAATLFAPLFGAVFERRLALVPGNIPASEVRRLLREGRAAVLPERRQQTGVDRTLPEPLLGALRAELKGSHCGMLPDTALDGMALAQHARDASMAHALVRTAVQHGRAVLLAGNGHVRSDRGVPWHLRALEPTAHIVTVMLVEVEDGRTDPRDYMPRGPDGKPAVDAIVFTPPATREDPCEKMRAHMKSRQ